MTYEYCCAVCGEVFETSHRMGEAPEKCESPCCGSSSSRHYGSCSFVLKGGGWPRHKRVFNREMTRRNEDAGRRMRKEHDPPPKLVPQ